jgi:hypothetical protein
MHQRGHTPNRDSQASFAILRGLSILYDDEWDLISDGDI